MCQTFWNWPCLAPSLSPGVCALLMIFDWTYYEHVCETWKTSGCISPCQHSTHTLPCSQRPRCFDQYAGYLPCHIHSSTHHSNDTHYITRDRRKTYLGIHSGTPRSYCFSWNCNICGKFFCFLLFSKFIFVNTYF